jgi:transcriptional regulator with XRE-family HTH domain
MIKPDTFPERLNALRKAQHLTTRQLAKRAGVYQPLISSLETGHRVIGERNARQIGEALRLTGKELEDFVYLAVNQCTEKVLNEFKGYPAELLNLIAAELRGMGILPERIKQCVRNAMKDKHASAAVYLDNGKTAVINL